MSALQSLIATGTKLYLDSVDPKEVDQALQDGAVGATSNPVIIGGIIAQGGFDDDIKRLAGEGKDDSEIAWALCDKLVADAQAKFLPIWECTGGEAGWVSFELDPLLEDPSEKISEADRAAKYVELGKRYAEGHKNRMIKVPGTPGGIAALEELAAAGVTLNITLLFSDDQYRAARDAVWKGAKKRASLNGFKSVYSIFISRIDVYTSKHVDLSDAAQGQVGLLNAKRIWRENCDFWAGKKIPLAQEMIFASTGAKLEGDPPEKYVAALAGSDIQTNPPSTNDALRELDKTFTRTVDQLPPQPVQDEIDAKVDAAAMHEFLMEEGLRKFAEPQRDLIKLIAKKRAELT
ncbi:transaldolase family protein [Alienimonas californiensis]|uniref:Transaldolase n=1 Tax=Alienimonas californiensis TaxID=2527989 RepID=A0A517PAF3_9PLAN|nr:transaldolase family protein [Alienimonas californiensis]QDT16357.1 Transaldolase [Alienimonas californiensis]